MADKKLIEDKNKMDWNKIDKIIIQASEKECLGEVVNEPDINGNMSEEARRFLFQLNQLGYKTDFQKRQDKNKKGIRNNL